MGWSVYGLFFLLAAIAAGRETKQIRETIRLDVKIPAVIHYVSGVLSRLTYCGPSMGAAWLHYLQINEVKRLKRLNFNFAQAVSLIPVEQIGVNEKAIA